MKFENFLSDIQFYKILYNPTDYGLLEHIARKIHQEITYTPDFKKGCLEFWQLPEETLTLKTGDCEDTSILALDTYKRFEFNVYMALGSTSPKSNQPDHAWVVIFLNNQKYIVETTNGQVYSTNPLTPLQSLLSPILTPNQLIYYQFGELLTTNQVRNLISQNRSCFH